MHVRESVAKFVCGSQDTVVQGNTAGSADASTGLGGGIFMGDKCSGGACTTVGANLQNVTLSLNYAHLVSPRGAQCLGTSLPTPAVLHRESRLQGILLSYRWPACKLPGMVSMLTSPACVSVQAGGALLFQGVNNGSSLTMNASLVSSNYVDSSFTGSTSSGLGGEYPALLILHCLGMAHCEGHIVSQLVADFLSIGLLRLGV